MRNPTVERSFKYDAFISYSRRDLAFARRLERALNGYTPPRDLAVPQRRLRVFRDEQDLTGTELGPALERNLEDSAKLIVICSPQSAASHWVGEEIRKFAQRRGREHVIPVLLEGVPNNEATATDAERVAFPAALVQLLPVPLAADFRTFDAASDRVQRGSFEGAWYKTLADLYADHGVDRAQIERRERKRAARRLRIVVSTTAAVVLALSGLLIWALISRAGEIRERRLAEARRYDSESRLAFDASGDGLVRAALLSVASVRSTPTAEALDRLVVHGNLLPRAPAWTSQLSGLAPAGVTGGRTRAIAFSPDGRTLAGASVDGVIEFIDASDGRVARRITVTRPGAGRTTLAFSPDGRWLVAGCGPQACVIDVASGAVRARIPEGGTQGETVWSASFSPAGSLLATSSYHSGDVLLYDPQNWTVRSRIATNALSIHSVAFSPDGGTLATGDYEWLRLWRTALPDRPAVEHRTGAINWDLAFSARGGFIVSASRRLETWQIQAGAAGNALQRRAEVAITAPSIELIPGSDDCFAVSAEAAVSVRCGDQLVETLRVPRLAAAIAVQPDGRAIAAVDTTGILALWPIDAGAAIIALPVGGSVEAFAGGAGDWVAAGTDTGDIIILDATTWRELRRLDPDGSGEADPVGGRPRATAVSRLVHDAGSARLVAARGSVLHAFDTRSWERVFRADMEHDIDGIAFDTARGRIIVVAGTRVAVYEADGRSSFTAQHEGPVTAVRLSDDGSRLATVTAREFARGPGLTRPTRTRVFALSGEQLGWQFHVAEDVAAGYYLPRDSALHPAVPDSGQTQVITAARAWNALALDHDTADTAPGDARAVTDPWRLRVADPVPAHLDVNATIRIPRDQPRWLVTGGEDGRVRVWPLHPDGLVEEVCRRLRAIVGAGAWRAYLDGLAPAPTCTSAD